MRGAVNVRETVDACTPEAFATSRIVVGTLASRKALAETGREQTACVMAH
jgi:hypothetical protein